MLRAALLLLTVLALAGCGGDEAVAPEAGPSDGAAAGPNEAVKELANVLQLRSDFEADAGKARAIVLLSPT